MNSDLRAAAPAAAIPWGRAFYWSVRRELWEHRYVYLAPAAMAAFVALAHFISALVIPEAERRATLADPAKAHEFMSLYGAAAFGILLASLVVAVIYCLGALHGERRDRSILFWKSLPVSDRTTVLAKAAVPILVLPVVVFALVVAANLVMVTLQSVVWQLDGFDPRQLWARLDLPFLWLALLYGLPFMVLWNAPLYAWLLLVSAWAKRVPFLWAIVPLVVVGGLERLVFHGGQQPMLIARWFSGDVRTLYTKGGEGKVWIHQLSDLEPLRAYTHPVLWGGLLVAALLLFLAIRLRRSRAPL